jgi:uncharacterized protein (DUF983 family)
VKLHVTHVTWAKENSAPQNDSAFANRRRKAQGLGIKTENMMSQSPIMLAMKRGLKRRCPTCGEAPLFRSYVKVEPICPVCGAANGEHRVDDAASYFTVLLVGHLVIAPMLAFEVLWNAPLAWVLGISIPLVGLVTLAALPFIKGAIVGVLSAQARRARAEAVRPPVSPSAPPPAP